MAERVGHYQLLERLGGGALGDVYRARDTKVGRTVALMQAPAQLIPDATVRARFLEDARTAVTLNHPNIAALFEAIEQDGHCYLAYEFAAGPSLRAEMAGVPLGVRRAVTIAAQLADALAEGHSRGIVHGDLRPETIVITPKGSPKILNFGMVPWTSGGAARSAAARSPETLTPEAASIAAYLSPEQAAGAPIDARSDLFTLGAVLHEMLTGRSPFEASTAASTLRNVLRARPPLPSRRTFDVPPELDALLVRAMSKSVEARHRSAAEMASALRGIAGALDARSGEKRAATVMPPREERRSARWWGAAAAAVAAAGLWWLWR